MEVKLVQMSDNAVGLMYLAARNCYSAGGPSQLVEQIENKFSEDMWKLVGNVLKSGHESIAEHVYFTFTIEGMSRACLAQISRHRHASLSVQSQRYVEIKEDYNTIQELYTDAIQNRTLSSIYNLCKVLDKYFSVDRHNFITLSMILMQYLSDTQSGVKAEDARMILPNCTKTNMVISMNLRELIHISELRLCKRAQAEVREMVQEMCNLVVEKEPLFKELFGPPCKKYGKCKEAHPCTEK